MTAINPLHLVQAWLQGRARLTGNGELQVLPKELPSCVEKLRRAYHWISEQAIHCPYTDIDFGPPRLVGQGENRVELPRELSFSSFILLPLLNLVICRRLVFVGAPGRGKTTVATLMGLLAGHSITDMKHAIQHGHPQLTMADLLGSPLPSELIHAKEAHQIKVSWRRWISMRVKIIDEYNRIPTKTQSSLLSLMAEGYAEMFEQIIHTGKSAWYLTANDDLGGGTFPVIEALKDRIDIVVRCMPFHARYLDSLVDRVAEGRVPEEYIPSELIFTPEELEQIEEEIRTIAMPVEVQDMLGFFLGPLDFCRRASDRLEYKNKDTLHLAGRRVGHVCNEDCPLDKQENLCSQTENGVSARAYQTLIHFAKALAYFRGFQAVSTDDVRQLLPWILHDKLQPNQQSQFFQKSENHVYVTDRVSWIRQMFDKAVAQYAAYQKVRQPILKLRREAEDDPNTLPVAEIQGRIAAVQQRLEKMLQDTELNAAVYEDLVLLKEMYTRYQNHLQSRQRTK